MKMLKWITVIANLQIMCLNWKVSGQTCTNGTNCPDYLPFCTSAGCVFQCPEDVFINGSSCVEHCGDAFIYNKSCVSTCPSSYTLREEKIVSINSMFHKLRYCVVQCRANTYIYEGLCLMSCPSDAKFVDNGQCTGQCSSWKAVHRNISLGSTLIGIECLSSCENTTNFPFQQGNECVGYCKADDVVFDSKCMPQCPLNAPLSIDRLLCSKLGICAVDWPNQTYCSNSCIEGYFVDNNRCVDVCPKVAPYAYNGQCLSTCPEYFYYGRVERDLLTCFKECPSSNLTNPFTMECVDECPENMKVFNHTCVEDCPEDTFIKEESNRTSCVNRCDKLVFNKTCVDNCPHESKFNAEGYCSTRCPESRPYVELPYMYHRQTPNYCVDRCIYKANNVTFNCEYNCPGEMVTYGSICLANCPPNSVKTNGTFNQVICVDRCPYINNGSCVDVCPNFNENNTCVETCSKNVKFIYEKSCVNMCPNTTCLADDGKTCVKECSYDLSRNSLVHKCPEHTPYQQKFDSGTICVATCEKDQIVDELTCKNVTECNKAVLSNGRCEDQCPEGSLYFWITGKSSFHDSVFGYGYSYDIEDAKSNPCVSNQTVTIGLIFFGTSLIFYAIGMSLFMSTRPISASKQKNGKERNECQKETDTTIEEEAACNQVQPDDDDIPLVNFDQNMEDVIVV